MTEYCLVDAASYLIQRHTDDNSISNEESLELNVNYKISAPIKFIKQPTLSGLIPQKTQTSDR